MLGYKNEELDLLIFFYLQECGYFHSAFTFSCESDINLIEQKENIIPPGLLVSIYQRGLLYSDIETNFSQSYFDNLRSPILDFFYEKKRDIVLGYNFIKNINFHKIITFLNQNSIQSYTWHPRKFAIYLSTVNFIIYKWKIQNFKIINNLSQSQLCRKSDKRSQEKNTKNEITNIDFNFNGTIVVSTTHNGFIYFWAETGKFLKKFFTNFCKIEDVKWSENSRFIAISCLNGKITIFSSWYFQILNQIYLYSLNFLEINWISNKNLLFSTTRYIIGMINLSKKKIYGIFAHSSKTCDIDLYLIKNFVCTCSRKGNIRVWIYNFKLVMLFEINAHYKEITAIKWKPNYLCYNLYSKKIKKALRILSVSLDCSVKIWNVSHQICIFSYNHQKPFISATWNLYQNKFLVGLAGGIVIQINFTKREINEKKVGKFGIFDINSHSMSRMYSFVSSNRLSYW
nr:regulator of epidermal growth factor receptor [Cryptomonas curvata]|mmetsp:Transcript_21121/g.44374  ORF Transcript_21121/g.44374 Transcript_21121/m.44374 type:complete len:456 (-) Transcript_21121:51-1418(-)